MSILFYKEFHQQLSGVDCRNQIGLYFGPCYGSGEGRKKKKNLPSLAPGAPFIGGQCGSKMAHILVATSYIGAHQTSVVRTH